MSAVETLVAEATERKTTLARAAEAAADEIAKRHSDQELQTGVIELSAQHRELFQVLGMDQRAIGKLALSMRQIRHLQAQAGTTADREAAAARLLEARNRQTKREGEINDELSKLRREAVKLRQETEAAAAVVETQGRAVAALQDPAKLPKDITNTSFWLS
jgi:hypothetical protein